MTAEAWITLGGILLTVIIVPLFRLLLRIDRRLFSIATNHLPHIYDRMMELDGREVPDLDDLK